MAAYALRSVYSIEKRDFGEDKHGSWLGLAAPQGGIYLNRSRVT